MLTPYCVSAWIHKRGIHKSGSTVTNSYISGVFEADGVQTLELMAQRVKSDNNKREIVNPERLKNTKTPKMAD